LVFQKFGGDVQQAVGYVMFTEPAELRREMELENSSWSVVCGKAARLRESREAGTILRRARTGQIDTSARLFACQACDKYWWLRVPDRKTVSKCSRCKVRYDAVPRAKEWGKAQFKCNQCSREFSGFCGIWVSSPCYQCQTPVKPFCITPPSKDPGPRRSNNVHRCNGAECGGCGANSGAADSRGARRDRRSGGRGRSNVVLGGGHSVQASLVDTDPGSEADYDVVRGPDEDPELPNTCVHPTTRLALGLPVVIFGSCPHDSSGSTVDTFLPQGDLCQTYETITMPVIDEGD